MQRLILWFAPLLVLVFLTACQQESKTTAKVLVEPVIEKTAESKVKCVNDSERYTTWAHVRFKKNISKEEAETYLDANQLDRTGIGFEPQLNLWQVKLPRIFKRSPTGAEIRADLENIAQNDGVLYVIPMKQYTNLSQGAIDGELLIKFQFDAYTEPEKLEQVKHLFHQANVYPIMTLSAVLVCFDVNETTAQDVRKFFEENDLVEKVSDSIVGYIKPLQND